MGGASSIHFFDNLPVATLIEPKIPKTDNPLIVTPNNDSPEMLRTLRDKVKDRLYYMMDRNNDILDIAVEMRILKLEDQMIRILIHEICKKHNNQILTALDNIHEIDIYHSTIVTFITANCILHP